ncbi:unnamed protein product [Onchocerca flexuosa]|uniref:30S ribosomal protein S8 n=1 Tax=Onchocerca flexuosa TaxID=387005 RepID=A0A183HHV4_9BILA|nr:unnamed protein product [Onchocerca flexuosa]
MLMSKRICTKLCEVDCEVDLYEVYLYEVLKKNMVNGPHIILNPNSTCMLGRKCSKRYPRALISYTVTGNGVYALCRRSAEDGGKLATIQMWISISK